MPGPIWALRAEEQARRTSAGLPGPEAGWRGARRLCAGADPISNHHMLCRRVAELPMASPPGKGRSLRRRGTALDESSRTFGLQLQHLQWWCGPPGVEEGEEASVEGVEGAAPGPDGPLVPRLAGTFLPFVPFRLRFPSRAPTPSCRQARLVDVVAAVVVVMRPRLLTSKAARRPPIANVGQFGGWPRLGWRVTCRLLCAANGLSESTRVAIQGFHYRHSQIARGRIG